MSVPLVLIVEDVPEIAQLATMNMEMLGVDYFHVDTGEKAIDFLDEYHPDLILLDLNLPGVNGWKVLEHAKDLYGEGNFKVVVTTANTDEVNRLVGKMQLVNNYINKPYTMERLREVVTNVLEE